jgi:hypothetical protein
MRKVTWRDNDWFPDVLKREIDHMRRTDPDEYEHVWEGSCISLLQSAIYANELRAVEREDRVTSVPYDRSRPVDCYWDLGYGDMTAVWFAQSMPFQYRLIDYIEDCAKPLQWYCERWCKAALERLSQEYLNLLAQYAAFYLRQDCGLGYQKAFHEERKAERYKCMKLISRLVAILMLCAAAPLFGAISLVAHTSAVTANGTNVTTTAINTTGANFIVVAASASANTGTVTDSNGNTWTALTQYGPSGHGAGMRLFYCYNPTVSSAQTFTFSDTTIDYPTIAVAAWSGAAASPFDAQNGSTAASGAGTYETGSITPSANGELLISAIGESSTSPDTIDSSFTVIEHQNHLGDGSLAGFGISLGYLVQATAASVNPSWTVRPQQGAAESLTVASFKAVPGGGVQLISGGTAAMGTAAIPQGACASPVTSRASGVAVNDTIIYNTKHGSDEGYRVRALRKRIALYLGIPRRQQRQFRGL